MLTCGELLVQLLEELGVEVVFGIPGVHTVELYRGLGATRIRHVTPRHEQGAGFMADGFARVTGRPGVCFIVTGPGMTNIATAMGQAYADSIPMLVVSSVNRSAELGMGGGRLHELPSQRNLFSGLTAFSQTLMRPDDLPALLTRAFSLFSGARPRPVHIEIPIDVIAASADHVDRRLGARATRPCAEATAIERAARWLAEAARPLVLFGGGARDAGDSALALVESLDAPFACTINAKGMLPPRHPLSVGSNQSLAPVRELIAQSDAVLAVGTELGETDYDVLFDGKLALPGRLIRIDIDAEQVNRNFPAELAIVSDADMALRMLVNALPERSRQTNCSSDSGGGRRAAEVRARLEDEWPREWHGRRLLLETLQRVLPEAIIAGDSAQPVYAGNHLFEAARTRSWFNATTGYGTLGYGLPAAIGAKIAAPDRPVISLIGDGGIQFTLPELASAVEADAPVIVLLWNNDGYGEIKRYMNERGIRLVGVDIYTPDFIQLAKGFGCLAERIGSLAHLERALREAARASRPTLLEVREDAAFLAAG